MNTLATLVVPELPQVPRGAGIKVGRERYQVCLLSHGYDEMTSDKDSVVKTAPPTPSPKTPSLPLPRKVKIYLHSDHGPEWKLPLPFVITEACRIQIDVIILSGRMVAKERKYKWNLNSLR